MDQEGIIKKILSEAIYVHKEIGPGMLESVYKNCLAYRLTKSGVLVETEKAVPVFFEEIKMECGYRADIVVNGCVVVEAKSIDGIGPLQIAQVLTYLRFLKIRYGLILNFNNVLMKDGIKKSYLGLLGYSFSLFVYFMFRGVFSGHRFWSQRPQRTTKHTKNY